jgi:hypothetical protein
MCYRGRVLAKLAFAAYLLPSLTRHYPAPTDEEEAVMFNAGHVSEGPQ